MKGQQLELIFNEVDLDRTVKKSNVLVETPHDLDVHEQHIILTLASQVNEDDENFKTHYIKAKEMAELLNIQEKNYYKRLREIVTGLQSKMVVLRDPIRKTETQVNWLSASVYHDGKGYIELEFSNRLKPHFLQLKDNLVKYKLWNIIRLKSKYSIRIYELLKRYENEGINYKYYKLEDLRYVLGVDKDTLSQYKHFKSKVLHKAQEDLEEMTDIKFIIEEHKEEKGKKVTAVTFHISKNNKFVQNLIDGKQLDGEPASILINFNIDPKKATDTVKQFGKERTLQNIRYVVYNHDISNIEDKGSVILRAIIENHAGVMEQDNPEEDNENMSKKR